MRREDRLPLILLGIDLVALGVSGIQPKDRLTWWLEVAPFLLALPVLLATYRRFRFTNLVYVLIAVHACVLFLGGHYTYAEVPLGFWAQRVFGLARNDYDRVGHFFQGFVPAMVTRELLLRRTPLQRGGWLSILVVSVCLAISALYELVEWGAAVTLAPGRRGVPRDAGRPLGHPGGHGDVPGGGHRRAAPALAVARPAARVARENERPAERTPERDSTAGGRSPHRSERLLQRRSERAGYVREPEKVPRDAALPSFPRCAPPPVLAPLSSAHSSQP